MVGKRLLFVVAMAVGVVSALPAGEARRTADFPKGNYAALDKLPDWGGVWVLGGGAPGQTRVPPQLKGTYLARYEAWQKQTRDNGGVATRDTSNCMPPGMPRMMGTGQYPIEFLFTPGRVTMHHEAWMQTRTIFTDGRGHPDDLEAAVFGNSIGRWEGDTLVVDTVGIKTITEIETGMKHSDKLRVTERIHLDPANPDRLLVEMTMEDPEALAAPYKRTHTFRRERDWQLMEFVCAENDRNPVSESGQTGFE